MEYDELLAESIRLQNEAIDLKNKNEHLKNKIDELLDTLREKENHISGYQNQVENDIRIATWQNIVDEIAHSINTDIFVAVYYLSKKAYSDDPQLKKALYHTKQIRDLINLFMRYIRRADIKLSGEKEEIDLTATIKEQIALIKDGISTLRISNEDHEKRLLEKEIEVIGPGNLSVKAPVEYKEAVILILKDLLRNAMKHSSEESPEVSVDIRSKGEFSEVTITNNSAIPQDYADWLNDYKNAEPAFLSKSVKVGLRVIKMWKDFLRLRLRINTNEEKKITTISILFPKEIKVE